MTLQELRYLVALADLGHFGQAAEACFVSQSTLSTGLKKLEDYLGSRYYSRAQQLLREFQVPVYLTAGNHDLGGWDDTPPADGTARRDWWRTGGGGP